MTAPFEPSPTLHNEKARRVIIGSLVLSLLIHLVAMLFAYRVTPFAKRDLTDLRSIDVSVVESRLPVAETLQETATEKPVNPTFESSRNLKTDEETSPSRAPMDMANKGGAAKQIPKPKARTKAKPEGTLFTLNQKELVAERENRETLTAEGQGIDSTGFYERLKRGEMLKINAAESDYAQFIRRMKEKIIQHWSPQKTVTTEMYNYNEVMVTIGVVLNLSGEIVELRTVSGSFFPQYDQECLRALREAGPYPNPHKSLIQDDGFVYIPWTLTLYMRGAASGYGVQ